MRTFILLLAIVTAFLLGAQVSAYVSLPLLWGVWAIIIICTLIFVMAKINGKK